MPSLHPPYPKNPYFHRREPATDPMRNPFPWLCEERVDNTRLVRRCAELNGGCGESEEVALSLNADGIKQFPGFITWHRKHTRCGLVIECGLTQQENQ